MATYTPLIGNNLLVSFVDNGAAAVTKSASENGRPGKNRFAASVTVDPGAVANEAGLILTLNSPCSSALQASPDLYIPVISICPADQAAAATTPSASFYSASNVTVDGQSIIRQVFLLRFTPGAAGNRNFYLNIDWGYTASN